MDARRPAVELEQGHEDAAYDSLGSRIVRRALVTAAVLASFVACSSSHPVAVPSAPKTMELATPYVINAARLPRLYTCDGDNVSPAFQWAGVPANAKELALLMVDRDSPGGRFVHWAVFGMPAQDGSIALGKPPPGKQARNDYGKVGYGGPCPPKRGGTHHYVVAIYALSAPLTLHAGASADDVRRSIAALAVAEGQTLVTYSR